MTSVITGDIMGSRKLKDPEQWMEPLKGLLNQLGPQPLVWDIYRGDAFQVEVADPLQALKTALHIKALVKSKTGAGARLSIGIGSKDYAAARISESNGEAFVLSGMQYENLKKEKISLALQTPWPDVNSHMNVCLRLALIAIESWSTVSAEYVALRFEKPEQTQLELANLLGIRQSSVSARNKRAYFDELMALEAHYRELIHPKLKP